MTSSSSSGTGDAASLSRTALYDLHLEAGARMVPFAGYEMPVSFPMGIVEEHKHTRTAAGLFDVSHMGQAYLTSSGDVSAALEKLVPGNIAALKPGRMRYTQLLNPRGGIIDDLMVTRLPDRKGRQVLLLVVNAACKENDFALIRDTLGNEVDLDVLDDRALLALQGPQAVNALERLAPAVSDLAFMAARTVRIDGQPLLVSRCGYTGEDGFEISIPQKRAATFARRLLAENEVEPIGLGARDTLRLEAGLCLYGHDIDETTTPIEANLAWSIGKRRREEGGFPGADIVLGQLRDGPERLLVGIRPEGRAPAREGTEICDRNGDAAGVVTSGGFGPTLGGPIAMGYVTRRYAQTGTDLALMIRGKPNPGTVTALPFVPHRYYKP